MWSYERTWFRYIKNSHVNQWSTWTIFFFCSTNLSIYCRIYFFGDQLKIINGCFGSTRVTLYSTMLLPSAGVFMYNITIVYYNIYTMILFVPVCTRDNLERRKDSHDGEPYSSSASVHVCDVANDDRCVDGTGVGGYGS